MKGSLVQVATEKVPLFQAGEVGTVVAVVEETDTIYYLPVGCKTGLTKTACERRHLVVIRKIPPVRAAEKRAVQYLIKERVWTWLTNWLTTDLTNEPITGETELEYGQLDAMIFIEILMMFIELLMIFRKSLCFS